MASRTDCISRGDGSELRAVAHEVGALPGLAVVSEESMVQFAAEAGVGPEVGAGAAGR